MEEKENREEFFEELDKINFRMPGNAYERFSENQILLQMMEQQYPRWKDPGKITSVPVARVPKMFLHGSQLEKSLQKQLKSLSTGDDGEIKLYRLFMDGNFLGQPGAIVFPNVDGSHIFKCKAGKVEIDMVLIHSKKGIFVFNVKNQGGKVTSAKEVKEDIDKHSKFIRMLNNYKSSEDNCFTPIHTVICDFANEKTKFTKLETRNENTGEHIIVLNKKDLETANFIKTWISRIAKISDVVWNTSLDVLVARMMALASIEGGTSLIHEQMRTGVLQSTNKKQNLQYQMRSFGDKRKLNDFRETVSEHSEVENPKGKKRFILWTKAQMAVIAKVYQYVTTSQDRGLRLLVTGGRGTGKTMLLVFLAKMVQSIIEIQTGERTSRTMVIEGTNVARGLLKVLKEELCSSNVTVYDTSGWPYFVDDVLTSLLPRAFDDERITNLLEETLQRSHFCLCDENIATFTRVLLKKVTGNHHCVLFMSYLLEGHEHVFPDFEVMHLDACLRSSGQLATFANDVVKILRSPRCYLTIPCRSFQGERIDIKFAGETGDKISFIDLCVRTIVEYAQKMHDVEFLPVANLLEVENTRLIKEALEKMSYICSFDELPAAFEDRKSSDSHSVKPLVILFINPIEYEGCEFPVVLILMDKSIWGTRSEKGSNFSFSIALTRASLKLVIIVDDSSLLDDEDLKLCLEMKQVDYIENRLKMIEFSERPKPTFLFVGRCPDVEQFERELNPPQMYLPDVEGISCYVGRHSRVLHVDDVYLESDLKKLNDFGSKFIINWHKSIECEWHHLYHLASKVCMENFKKKTPDAFKVDEAGFNFDTEKLRIKVLLAFLKQQSGESDTEIPRSSFDLQPQTLPEIDIDWLNWKSKAEELFRIKETAMARALYDRSILLLERERENDIQQGNRHGASKSKLDLAKLWTNISKIHLEEADGFYDGKVDPGVDFWGAIRKAFHATMQGIVCDPRWSRSYERMNAIVEKLKSRGYSCSTDSCDSQFDYRGKFSEFLSENTSVLSQKTNFLKGLEELYDSIEHYKKKL